jgi:protein TonB
MTKSKKILAIVAFATFSFASASVFCQIDDKTVVQDSIEDEDDVEDVVFVVVEHSPEFPSKKGFDHYLTKNLQYPAIARTADIEGYVAVSFIVEKDGTITNIKVLRDIGGGCGDEVMRVLREMPKWKPAMQRGKPVRFQYGKAVKFSLDTKIGKKAKITSPYNETPQQ